MKIAILIGVEKYKNGTDLPACKADVEIIEKIINATENYAEVLVISENKKASNIKAEVSEFVDKYKNQSVEEVFFYFTGHGEYNNDEFYYILSDFDESKRKQTSLENSEVDNWLRSLNPELTIKVVDACQSGTTYIKENNGFSSYLEKSKSSLKNCYFMYSSHQEQSSYQDRNLSYFTKSFADSLCTRDDITRVRYKDIVDYISDDFDENTSQTPIFITQAAFTEVFCTTNQEINSISCPENDGCLDKEEVAEVEANKNLSLEELVKSDADEFLSEKDTEVVLASIKTCIDNYEPSSNMKLLYDFEVSYTNHDGSHYDGFLPREREIGKWLNRNSEGFFCIPYREEESFEDEVIDHRELFRSRLNRKYRTVTKQREVIKGYENTVKLSYDLIEIYSEPQYPNIPKMKCIIVIIVSKKSIVFFRAFAPYTETSWNSRELVQNVQWGYSIHRLKESKEVIERAKGIYNEFASYINEHLETKFSS